MKKIILGLILIIIGYFSVYALSNNFVIDSSKLSFSENSKKESILRSFNQNYTLTHSISSINSELEKEIIALTKKTTYLLLGDVNNNNESSENYYKRHQEYLKLRYDPKIPKDNTTFTGLDENSQEYKDDLVSGIAVPSMFLLLDELNITYSSIGNIRISKTENGVISVASLPNIKMREPSTENPMEYKTIQTNLIIYYYFKELNGEYKLYYLMSETTESLSNYFNEIEDAKNASTMQIAPSYESNIKDIYSYSKLESITTKQLNNIYNLNENNIFVLNSYYNNYVVKTANGFAIKEGLIITTWDFIEKSLADAQYITIKDNNGKSYEIQGIVTANLETDIVVIKLKSKTNGKVSLGESDTLKIEDPVITISSKTGVGLTLQSGIVISNDSYIQSSIPLLAADEGSPLFNSDGQAIGINTAKQVNTSISLAVNANALKEIRDKFSNIDFDKIETVSFNELKEKYYYIKYSDEIIKNDIPSSKWKKYSKIGDIEKNISLQLVKASYKDGIVSLRYSNGLSKYISSMQLTSAFKEQLINEGYKQVLNGNRKCVYKSDDYKIIIMDEFDYLIVVMVEL